MKHLSSLNSASSLPGSGLTQFDAFLIVFFLICAVLAFGAIGLYLDSVLDPGCNCAEKRRQEQRQQSETAGVRL